MIQFLMYGTRWLFSYLQLSTVTLEAEIPADSALNRRCFTLRSTSPEQCDIAMPDIGCLLTELRNDVCSQNPRAQDDYSSGSFENGPHVLVLFNRKYIADAFQRKTPPPKNRGLGVEVEYLCSMVNKIISRVKGRNQKQCRHLLDHTCSEIKHRFRNVISDRTQSVSDFVRLMTVTTSVTEADVSTGMGHMGARSHPRPPQGGESAKSVTHERPPSLPSHPSIVTQNNQSHPFYLISIIPLPLPRFVNRSTRRATCACAHRGSCLCVDRDARERSRGAAGLPSDRNPTGKGSGVVSDSCREIIFFFIDISTSSHEDGDCICHFSHGEVWIRGSEVPSRNGSP
ncbi:hypothetical protein CEXT_205781 [Caerostris extrusa]|uniref:Uncharacterized protein n=1 Tax=Caerostris extrusa TaxID=172846 RepID=A0AAV4WM51_CAEEX|nr:hypothetical protein CEXT_205781 [Caerostris extrusa]